MSTNFILNPDGSAYHLHLKREQIAPTIVTVGDPARVAMVAKFFKTVRHNVAHREFVTCTGTLQNDMPITVISTGIGTANIEIVLSEIDALFNWDAVNNTVHKTITPLQFIRIGTTGAIREDIALDTFLVAARAVGFDNLMNYYDYTPHPEELLLAEELIGYFERRNDDFFIMPYAFRANKELLEKFNAIPFELGNTVTTPGFYAPQGRELRLALMEKKLIHALNKFNWSGITLTNLEMETSALYGLAHLMGHSAISLSVVLANRITDTFSDKASTSVGNLIETTLSVLTN